MEYDSDAGRADAERRRFLKHVGAVALGGLLLGGKALASALHDTPLAEATAGFRPDIEIELAAIVDEVGLLPGPPTTVWRLPARCFGATPMP